MDTSEPLLASDEEGEENELAVKRYKGRTWMTVEPCLLLYFMAFMPLIPLQEQFVLQQLKLRKNISLAGNESQCVSNTSDPAYKLEIEVQGEAARWLIILTAVSLVPSFFATTLLGSYSDKAGRKKALLPPLFGAIIRCVLCIFVIQFDLPLEMLILASLLEGCTGGVATFIMASFAAIADITTHRQRTLRIFILEVALGIGTFVAQIAIGYIIKLLGYMYPFLIIGGLHVLNLFYTTFLFPESRPGDRSVPFFSMSHYKNTWLLYTKDDGSRRRWKLQLSLLLLILAVMVEIGGTDVLVYFIISAPLCFTPVLIGYFQGLLYVIRNLCGLLAVRFLNARVGEIGLMILGNVSDIVFLLLVAFSKTRTMAFVAPVGAVFFMLLVPMVRSFTSKLVSPDEQGTAFSAIGMTQSLAIVLGDALFNTIYSVTLDTVKNAVFFAEAGVLVVGIVFIVLLHLGVKREKRNFLVEIIASPDHD